MIRVLLADAAPGELQARGEASHYLSRVLRVAPGDELEVFDGADTAYPARVVAVEADAVRLLLGEGTKAPPLRPITVFQGLPKGDKLELVIQKGTELGASAFVPVACERSVAKVAPADREKKRGRWQKIASEAARQCGRVDEPKVAPAASLEEAKAQAHAEGLALLVLDEEERGLTLSAAYAALPSTQAVGLVVGPEGGLTRAEVAAWVEAGAKAVTLGRLVLRTETAAFGALSVMRHLDGVFA